MVSSSTIYLTDEQHLRPLNLQKDLLAVADLIELCFANNMDADGREYLRQMRQSARDSQFLRWAATAADTVAMPISGFVWEENGQIIGNASLIPLYQSNHRVYLVANIAVQPEHRRRGIARKLTQACIEYARERKAVSVWLQVRDDNPHARALYDTLGFIERARRTSWHNNLKQIPAVIFPEIQVTQRGRKDWEKQKEWLENCYPEEVRWNLPLNINFFSPGLWQDLVRFLNNEQTRHWAARDKNQLIGVLTWQPSRVTTDHLWLAVSPIQEERALKVLLPYACGWARTHRALEVNYPAGNAQEAFLESGFFAHVTLIWMEIKLTGM